MKRTTPASEMYSQGYDPILLPPRWRDPSIGRFISADSYKGSPSDPMSLHKYNYANDDPANLWDPSGHFSTTELALVGLLAAGLFTLFVGKPYYLTHVHFKAGDTSASWWDQSAVDAADQASIRALTTAQVALSYPDDATLLRVAHFFGDGDDRQLVRVPADRREHLYALAGQAYAQTSTLAIKAYGHEWVPGQAADGTGKLATTNTYPGFDAQYSLIYPGFFTNLHDETITMLHELSHAYLWTVDGDGRSEPTISVSGLDNRGAPTYANDDTGAATRMSNPFQHADTWGWFLDGWAP